jgi:hypothetical protein
VIDQRSWQERRLRRRCETVFAINVGEKRWNPGHKVIAIDVPERPALVAIVEAGCERIISNHRRSECIDGVGVAMSIGGKRRLRAAEAVAGEPRTSGVG